MRARADQLLQLLERMVVLYRNLNEVLREELGHMMALDVKSLIEVAHTKEALLSEIWSLEQNRLHVVNALVEFFQITPEEISLQKVLEKVNPQDQPRYKAAQEALRLLTGQAKDQNNENMTIAQTSLERIERMKRNILGLENNNMENYSASGKRNPVPEQGGKLLSQKA